MCEVSSQLPKLKTHKATAKRFKMTKSGKILRRKAGRSHLRRKKTRRVRVLFGQKLEVTSGGEGKRIQRLAPYLKGN